MANSFKIYLPEIEIIEHTETQYESDDESDDEYDWEFEEEICVELMVSDEE